ncbi:MAG: iron ABC transporter permease [Thermoanaerobaculia bacterium]
MSSVDRRLQGVLLLLGVWIAALLIYPMVGSQVLSWRDLFTGETTTAVIFWKLRLPRALLGLLAGGSLAVSGLTLQTLFRNPLAEPYTLGVASGAALGAVLALLLGGSGVGTSFPTVGLSSLLGALAVAAILVALSSSRFGGDSSTLLLAGIAISLSCSALILFVQFLADFTQTFRMVRWMMGGLAVVGFREVLWVSPIAISGVAILFGYRRELDLLLASDELASSRGLDLIRFRCVALGVTSIVIGGIVAVAGPIGFVGLIVPHILRRWLGHAHLYLIPACALGGGAFLTMCDLAARTILAPAELPVGILTALLGGPFFVWLLLRRRVVH